MLPVPEIRRLSALRAARTAAHVILLPGADDQLCVIGQVEVDPGLQLQGADQIAASAPDQHLGPPANCRGLVDRTLDGGRIQGDPVADCPVLANVEDWHHAPDVLCPK